MQVNSDAKLMEALKLDTVDELNEAEDALIEDLKEEAEEHGEKVPEDVQSFLIHKQQRLGDRNPKQYTKDVFAKELTRADALPDTFFAGAFNDFGVAEDVLALILEVADKRIPRKDGEELVIFPPLFTESNKNGSLRFLIERARDDTGKVVSEQIVRAPMEKMKHATIMLLFLEDGPICPCVRVHELETFKKLAGGWYSDFDGKTNAETFVRNFEE